ncbi:MAG: ABC transporter permease [Defluviitaleaceae bacterium]|nr:ABC transporter permease [Defluviitaleaceae bacterium]
MYKTILRRFLVLIPQLFLISVVMFVLAVNMPGDALSGMLDPNLPLATIEQMREDMGLNLPWYQRYINWVGGMLVGDFGRSTAHMQPVLDVIGERIWNTFSLGVYSLFLTYLIAIPLGVLAGKHSGTALDKAIITYAFVALAMPTLVLGIVMIFLFSPIGLGWFPLGGSVSAVVLSTGTPFEIFLNQLHHRTLPAISLSLVSTITIIFMLRANVIDRKASDYVTLARSKGVPSRTIFGKHILRNSLVPVASHIGLAIAFTFGGAVFIEMIFSYPGMGTLFLDSINRRDFPVANVIVMFFAFLTALGVLLSDIILTIVDPRIRIR